MCYELYFSTSSSEDFAKYSSESVHFERPEHLANDIGGILLNPAKWYVGSQSGCSCTFRHTFEDDLEFREPQDWCPEGEDEIRATIELYRIIATLVHGGHHVDCLDIWSGMEPIGINTISVSLGTVPEKAFRFFENCHFVFEP